MFAETLLVLGLAQPATWVVDESISSEVLALPQELQPVTMGYETSVPLREEMAAAYLKWAGLNLRALPSLRPFAEEATPSKKLIGELSSYKKLYANESVEVRTIAHSAIDNATALAGAIPSHLPTPKSMMLSDQAAIYWEMDGAYVEIDVDASGVLSAFGKRIGASDVMIDAFPMRDGVGQIAFPTALETMFLKIESVTHK